MTMSSADLPTTVRRLGALALWTFWLLAPTVAAAGVPGDVNGDGRVDVVDLVLTANMAAGLATPDARADLNGDSGVTDEDVRRLRELIIVPAAVVRVPLAAAVVGPGGSVLGDATFTVNIPAGALASGRLLSLDRLPEEQPFQPGEAAPVYEIAGLGAGQIGVVELRFKGAARGRQGLPQVAVGEFLVPHSANQPQWFYYRLDGDDVLADGDDVLVRVPAPRGPEGRGPTRAVDLSDYTLRISLLPTVWNEYRGERVTVYYPFALRLSDIQSLATALEQAYERMAAAPHSFPYPTGMRVQVCVRALDQALQGETAAPRFWSSYHGYIDINSALIRDRALVRIVAAHEFMHVIQGFYDTGRITMWLDEATATWAETLATPVPADYAPSVFQTNMSAPFGRWHRQPYFSWGWTKGGADEHGYGMSSLFDYLANRRADSDGGMVRRIYDRITAGRHPLVALAEEAPGGDFPALRHDFFRVLLTDGIYGMTLGNLVIADPRLRATPFVALLTAEEIAQGRELELPVDDLGATLVELAIDTQRLDPDSVVRAHLEGANGHLLAFNRRAVLTTFLGAGQPCGDQQWVIDTPAARACLDPFLIQPSGRSRHSLAYAVLNDTFVAPYDGRRDYTLRLAISQPYAFRPDTLLLPGMYVNGYPFHCPTVQVTGSLAGAFTSAIDDQLGSGPEGTGLKHVYAKLVRPLPQTIRLKVKLTMVGNRVDIGRDEYLQASLGNLYLFSYLSWNELDTDDLGSSRLIGPDGIDITVTAAAPVFNATVYAMIDYEQHWAGVVEPWSLLRPVLHVQLYATATPLYLPAPPGGKSGGEIPLSGVPTGEPAGAGWTEAGKP